MAIFPLLPEPSDTIIGYMDANGLTPLEAIDYSQLLDFYLSGPEALAALDLMEAFGFGLEEAAEIVDEYGAFDVEQALLGAMGDYDKFLTLLVGYAEGGGGGGMRDLPPSFAVGETVPLVLELVHPVTGEPIDDAVVSYTVCRTLEDGTVEIVLLGVMVYDGDLMAYTFDLDTTGLEPGVYDVYLGTDDGRSRHYQIVIEE